MGTEIDALAIQVLDDFMEWLEALPDGEVLVAQMMQLEQLLGEGQAGVPVDLQAVVNITERLANVAQDGPHAEDIIGMLQIARKQCGL